MGKMNFEACKAISEMAAGLFATQLSQLKIWEADSVDIDRLELFCINCAESIWERVGEKLKTRMGEDYPPAHDYRP